MLGIIVSESPEEAPSLYIRGQGGNETKGTPGDRP